MFTTMSGRENPTESKILPNLIPLWVARFTARFAFHVLG
jgi:hypothetical protein